jgi:hypothetical protein
VYMENPRALASYPPSSDSSTRNMISASVIYQSPHHTECTF